MINIVVPMAGRGSRFANAGYGMPKPLIDVHDKYMIEYVIENVRPRCEYRFIFLCLDEHIKKYNIDEKLKEIEPTCIVVNVNQVTEGAACTVLLAKEYIDNDSPIMIVNSDQYVDTDINEYLISGEGKDGLVMTMYANDNKWSYIEFDEENNIVGIREKEVVSEEATVGIYNFAKGKDFVRYAEEMIKENLRVNGEFYVAPVYNMMVREGKGFAYYNIGSVDNGMYGLGVPEDLNKFLKNPLSLKVFDR